MSPAADRRWLILAIVGAAFFMTVLDVAIVNVAIPSIQTDLNVTETTVQWVLIAYAITFGGFLLLGGRMADLLGRKRIFLVGLVLFTVASLVCGLANNISVLIGARAVQGVGAAIISPAALSIVTTTFEEGAERNKALGIWGALGGSGAAAGVLIGGILTEYLGWEWIFFVNVPVGALVFALALPFVPESRAELGHHRFDVAGAVTVTGGLALLVYAISKAPDVGWGSARTILLLLASIAILAVFVLIERRSSAPLVPFRIFRIRPVLGANVVGFLLGAVIFANFLVSDPLRPAGTRLVGGQDRSHVPRDRGDGRHLGRCRPGADDALRPAAGDHDGNADPGRRHGLVHPDPGRRPLLARPAAALPDLRARPGVRVRPGDDRCALPGRAVGRRARLGTDQHEPADRWCDRVAIASTIFTSYVNSNLQPTLRSGGSAAQVITTGYQHAFWALIAMPCSARCSRSCCCAGRRSRLPRASPAEAAA